MEPEEHLIEKYFQIAEGFFTKANIKVDRKEIDLLAIHPISGEKLHIESTVHTKEKLCIKSLENIAERKFNHSSIINCIRNFFHTTDYKKILVVWDVKDNKVIEKASEYGIEIQSISEILVALLSIYEVLGAKGSRDPVMRTIELIAKIQKIGRKINSKNAKILLQKQKK